MDEAFIRDFFRMPPKGEQQRGKYEGPVQGCICPPTSERTCQNPLCPRKPIPSATS